MCTDAAISDYPTRSITPSAPGRSVVVVVSSRQPPAANRHHPLAASRRPTSRSRRSPARPHRTQLRFQTPNPGLQSPTQGTPPCSSLLASFQASATIGDPFLLTFEPPPHEPTPISADRSRSRGATTTDDDRAQNDTDCVAAPGFCLHSVTGDKLQT